MPQTTFGKRQRWTSVEPPQRTTAPGGDPALLSPQHAAFFASLRAEQEAHQTDAPRAVPRSGRAALLAGLVIGCALAGFDVTGNRSAGDIAALAGAFGLTLGAASVLPGLILLGLVGGARASAMTVIAVHGVLHRVGQTGFFAYGMAGAAAALALAALIAALFGHAPAHGWLVEAAAGAGSGFLYRVFAGTRAV